MFSKILNNPNIINGIHIVFVAGLLVILALDKFPEHIVGKKNFLLVLAAVVALYHFWKLSKRMNLENKAKMLGERVLTLEEQAEIALRDNVRKFEEKAHDILD
jgi:hypothetical protein